MGMQTLTFGISAFRTASVNVQAVSHTPGHFSAASNGLEAPVVAPFAKSSAWVDRYFFHPGMDNAQRGLSIEIEDDVGIRNVYLVLQYYGVRLK